MAKKKPKKRNTCRELYSFLHLRVSKEEADSLRRRAKLAGTTVSEFVRAHVREKV